MKCFAEHSMIRSQPVELGFDTLKHRDLQIYYNSSGHNIAHYYEIQFENKVLPLFRVHSWITLCLTNSKSVNARVHLLSMLLKAHERAGISIRNPINKNQNCIKN